MFLEAKGITKSYDKLKVLKGIDLSIGEGEFLSIVGKSGAGKSTLLHILGTLDSPDGGELIFKNQIINTLKSKELANFRNKSIGFIFQFHHLLPEFNAIENVIIPAMIAKTDKKIATNEAIRLLEYLGLKDRLNHKPTELSGGEQQRVAIARALINSPALILADEPTGNLDTNTANELHQLFLQLNKDLNQSFVIVTHNNELASLSHRIIEMKDGHII